MSCIHDLNCNLSFLFDCRTALMGCNLSFLFDCRTALMDYSAVVRDACCLICLNSYMSILLG